MTPTPRPTRAFPTAAGVLLGLGLGGFFDGIVFHQILQWHHMVSSAGHPPDSLANLRLNTFWDGVFHASAWVFVVLGLALLLRRASTDDLRSTGCWVGALLVGFGLFNLVEGLVNHQWLGLHHVNETVPPAQWWVWDMGFLAWGAAMLLGGWLLLRRGRARRLPGEAAVGVR